MNRMIDTQQLDYLACNIDNDRKINKFMSVTGLNLDDFIKLYVEGIIKIDNLNALNIAVNAYGADTLIKIYHSELVNDNRIQTLKWRFKWHTRFILWIRLKFRFKLKKERY